MKYYLLGVSKCNKLHQSINIGDYIQALASSQFLPEKDGFLDRDEDLKTYQGEDAKIIMNGWFMHNPSNWPPSPRLNPLFVAFHLNPLAQQELTSGESIAYLKSHQPIGCRDQHTVKILQSYGVDAYFSGCMTLTLGETHAKQENDGNVYFVDPNLKLGSLNVLSVFIWSSYFLAHFPICFVLFRKKNLLASIGGRKRRFLAIAKFLHDYSKVFPIAVLTNATYVTQQSKYYMFNFKDDKERFQEAQRLVTAYSKASLVVTSRIHCALPCLGMGTPVIFTELEDDAYVSSSRMGGLMDFFNVIRSTEKGLVPMFKASLPISSTNAPANKTNWKPYAESLIKRCKDFMGS